MTPLAADIGGGKLLVTEEFNKVGVSIGSQGYLIHHLKRLRAPAFGGYPLVRAQGERPGTEEGRGNGDDSCLTLACLTDSQGGFSRMTPICESSGWRCLECEPPGCMPFGRMPCAVGCHALRIQHLS